MSSFPNDWFWIVTGDASQAWSSADGRYVTKYPDNAVTRIVSEDELTDVLRTHGLPGPKPSLLDYEVAIQRFIDTTAQGKQYADGVSLVSYQASTNTKWAGEAAAFIPWRDKVFAAAYQTLADVQAGTTAAPTIAAFIASLPAIVWP